MTRSLTALAAILFGVASTTSLAATNVPPFINRLAAADEVTAIVHVKGRIGLASVSGDSVRVQQALMQNAAETQAELLDYLRSAGARDVSALWATNSVIVTAPRKVFEGLARLGSVDGIFEDRIIPLPKVIEEEERPQAGPIAWGVKTVKADEVWGSYGIDGTGVTVGLIDTGVDASHPDLAGKIVGFKDFIGSSTTPIDGQGHGTHCAGTILGGSEAGQRIGVAPGAKMIVARVFGAQGASTAVLLKAMQWMIDPDGNPGTKDAPRLVSNSWGSNSRTDKSFWEIVDAWRAANIFPNFAAGNAGPNARTVGIPGGYLNAYAVGATDREDKIAYFSSRGPMEWNGQEHIKPEVSAPGHGVHSARDGGGYRSLSGTSMACPHVSGIITLLYQAKPDLKISEIEALLQSTATDLGAEGKDNDYGSGLVNAFSAVGMTRASGLAGRVVDTDGKPLAASIAYSGPGGTGSVTAGADGRFSLSLPEGTYKLTVSLWGYKPLERTVEVSADTQPLELALLSLPRGTVKGRVLGPDGQAVQASINVQATPLEALVSDSGTGAYSLSLPAGDYTLKVSARGFKVSSFQVAVRANQTQNLDLTLEAAMPFLLVDDDGGRNLEDYYKPLLSDGIFSHHDVHQDGAIESGEQLAPYIGVIWFTGDRSTALTSKQQSALTDYLQGGGRLFLTGQNNTRGLAGSTFLKDVLQLELTEESASIRWAVKGISGDPISSSLPDMGLNGPVVQESPDAMAPTGSKATPFLRYNTWVFKRYAGIRVDTGIYKVAYLGFGLEGVADESARQSLATKVISWLKPSAREVRARYEALPKAERAAFAAQAARLFGVASDSPDLKALKFLSRHSREVRRTLQYRD